MKIDDTAFLSGGPADFSSNRYRLSATGCKNNRANGV
jgi:hypothetical protein